MSRQRHRRAWVAVGFGGMSGPGRDHGASSPAPRSRAQYASSSSAVRVAWTAMIALLCRRGYPPWQRLYRLTPLPHKSFRLASSEIVCQPRIVSTDFGNQHSVCG